ncbi:hypothetical protein [Pseudomonas borbori]|uniref:hypothetical protein n=1 Tax=Pseudomonas borbori TaxID=289003 RepID=UPI001131D573|nr:hypothetical protein [Pseudomonas borbori]
MNRARRRKIAGFFLTGKMPYRRTQVVAAKRPRQQSTPTLTGTTQLNDIRFLFLSSINAVQPGIAYKRRQLARRFPLEAFLMQAAA